MSTPTSETPPANACAVLSGATGGLGKAIAHALSAQGWHLVLTDRDESALLGLKAELAEANAGKVVTVLGDVTDPALGTRLAEAVAATGWDLRGLINNAGVISGTSLEATTDEAWQRVFDINVNGHFRITRALLPQLRRTGQAAILNMSSVLGLVASSSMPAYCASKAALVGFTRSLAVDLAADGIRVNALCPGGVDTPMPRSLMADLGLAGAERDAAMDAVAARHLMKRLGQPGEIAGVVAFLLSERASFITGLAMPVDGGWSAC